ncbi:hypothetical protein [Nocardia sp. NPDC019302]|uniref:hypothetical protein n=1 Tax=Nocardia sp. NPDC019302 TaxID=3154592 RepID=UPI0033DA750B
MPEHLRIIDRALWVDHGDGNLDALTRELPVWADEWAERIVAAVKLADLVKEFINERPEYVTACLNDTAGGADYHRWQGGAEARRQLAERLGWTVPYEYGEKTTPKGADR